MKKKVNSKIKLFLFRISKQKFEENLNTTRTLIPLQDKFIEKTLKTHRSYTNLRSSATGSISNLISITPINDPAKNISRIGEGSSIFTPAIIIPNTKRILFKNSSNTSIFQLDNKEDKNTKHW